MGVVEDGGLTCDTAGCASAWPARRVPATRDLLGRWRRQTPAEVLTLARVAGWRIGRVKDRDDVRCPHCSRPDPVTVKLCNDLAARRD